MLTLKFGCVYGFYVPHPDSSLVVGICSFSYFAIVSYLTLHATFFEKGVLLEALSKVPSELMKDWTEHAGNG